MPKPPSRADRDLLAALREQGHAVTQAKLAAWRGHGLLPKPSVLRRGPAGVSVAPHPRWVYEAAEALAESSTSGRDWQAAGGVLFARGHLLPLSCLRECARWRAEKLSGPIRRQWEAAEARTPMRTGSADEREDVAYLATTLASRSSSTRRAVRQAREAVLSTPHLASLPAEAREDAAADSLAWRLADLVGVRLTPEQRHVARYGSRDAAAAAFVPALPSERDTCLATMTLREIYAVRRLLAARLQAGVVQTDRDLLDLCVWELTELRLNSRSRDVARPLPVSATDELDEESAEWEALADECPGQEALELWPDEGDEEREGEPPDLGFAGPTGPQVPAKSPWWDEPVHCHARFDRQHRLPVQFVSCDPQSHAWIEESEGELARWLGRAAQSLAGSWLGATVVPHPVDGDDAVRPRLVDPSTAHVFVAQATRGGRDTEIALYVGLVAQALSGRWEGLCGFFLPKCAACDPTGRLVASRVRDMLPGGTRWVTETQLPGGARPRDGWFDERLFHAGRLPWGLAGEWQRVRVRELTWPADQAALVVTRPAHVGLEHVCLLRTAAQARALLEAEPVDVLRPSPDDFVWVRAGQEDALRRLGGGNGRPTAPRETVLRHPMLRVPSGWCHAQIGNVSVLTASLREWASAAQPDLELAAPIAVRRAPRLAPMGAVDGDALLRYAGM